MRFEKYFENESPLYTTVHCGEPHSKHVDFHELDLQSFPLISDFKVEVGGKNELFAYVDFASDSLGSLSRLFNWDDAENRLPTMKLEEIPLGTTEKPWNDCEEGWEINIWEKDGTVYVIEGTEPCPNKFEVWFRVQKEDYVDAWAKILASHK